MFLRETGEEFLDCFVMHSRGLEDIPRNDGKGAMDEKWCRGVFVDSFGCRCEDAPLRQGRSNLSFLKKGCCGIAYKKDQPRACCARGG